MRRFSVVRSPPPSARASGEYSSTTQPVPSGRVRQATLDDDGTITCLSALPHDPDADRDSLFQHFLGCLEFSERAEFLNEGNKFWTQQIKDEVSKLRLTKPAADEQALQREANDSVKKTIQALAVSIEAQYKRTEVLRRALAKEVPLEQPDNPRGQLGGQTVDPNKSAVPKSRSLVDYVNESRKRWRASGEYVSGIEMVQEWKSKAAGAKNAEAKPTGMALEKSETKESGRDQVQQKVKDVRGRVNEEIADYDLQRDVNAYLIQYTRRAKPTMETANAQQNVDPPSLDPKMQELPVVPVEESLKDPRFKGKFPDQRLSVDLLLKSANAKGSEYDEFKLSGHSEAEWKILSKSNCDGKDPARMRYLHIPANNMEVSNPNVLRFEKRMSADLCDTKWVEVYALAYIPQHSNVNNSKGRNCRILR